MRASDMPLVRRSRVVAMKFSAPSREPMQKMAIEIAQRFWPMREAGPGISADGAERRVGRPAGNRRTVGDEKCSHHEEEGDKGGPEGHHVETREGHVLRADLDGQEIISEGGEGRVGSTKKTMMVPCMVISER